MKIEKSGIYYDMAPADYFRDPCPTPSLTQSIAKVLIERSPLHAWHDHPRLGGKPSEDEPAEKYVSAQAIGNAAHLMMIGRGRDVVIGEFDAWRSDKAKTLREQAEASGKIPILQKHFVRARNMVQVAQERIGGAAFRADARGKGEVVVAWQEGDLWFRTMIDWLDDDLRTCWDYKTTGLSCAPHALSSLMLNGGWDVQAAMHERALDALDPPGRGKRKFRFVAQENEKPYSVSICELPEGVLEMGRRKLRRAVDLWSACLRADVWPSYPPEVCFPDYPGWAEAKWLEREIVESEKPKNILLAG